MLQAMGLLSTVYMRLTDCNRIHRIILLVSIQSGVSHNCKLGQGFPWGHFANDSFQVLIINNPITTVVEGLQMLLR